jgi:hypothetical protein
MSNNFVNLHFFSLPSAAPGGRATLRGIRALLHFKPSAKRGDNGEKETRRGLLGWNHEMQEITRKSFCGLILYISASLREIKIHHSIREHLCTSVLQ